MKKVLCFGDSNTFGFVPETHKRYDEKTRWTGILRELCNEEFDVIEAGCNNRTAFCESSAGTEFSGYKILSKYLNELFDVVILAIGINDVQKIYSTTLDDVENGIKSLVQQAKKLAPKAKIILAAPARLNENILTHCFFSNLFDENSIEKSLHYPKIYEKIAQNEGCVFVNWDEIVETSDVDGLHFSKEAHKTIAQAMYEVVI